MAIKYLETVRFTKPDKTYYGAPQQLNAWNDTIVVID
jgi:hypothetical protein